MRLLLQPRAYLTVGQDFLISSMVEHCSLHRFPKQNQGYPWPSTKPELIVSSNPQDEDDANFLASMKGSSPFIVHLHYQLDYLDETLRKNVYKSVDAASATIVPAKFLANSLVKNFPNKRVYVVPNGVSAKLFKVAQPEETIAFRRTHGMSLSRRLIGYVGALTSAKGLQILHALAKKIDHTDAMLFVQYPIRSMQGELGVELMNDEAKRIKSNNADHVFVWADNTPRFGFRPVRAFDVLISPSLSEVQPLTVVESLASGVPVVATKSSPFFEEILQMGIKPECCRTIPLPRRFDSGACEEKELVLTGEEVVQVADDILAVIGDMQTTVIPAREELSEHMKKAGFSEQAMGEKFKEIYDLTIHNWLTSGFKSSTSRSL